MGRVKKYFQQQFKSDMFLWEHESASDFYLSCVQKNRSALPLLLIQCVIFLGCVAITVSSLVIMEQMFPNFGHWFIFMTHWGLILITLTSGLAFTVSLRVYFKGQLDGSFGLPWYVKAYWVLFNTTVPIAFFITLFYWIMLTDLADQLDIDYAFDPVLDVFIHAVNSALMLASLLLSRVPFRLLHFYCSLGLGIVYLLFSVIYYFAGGLSPFGEVWIYPQLDWSNPGEAVLTTVLSTVILLVMHCLVVGLALARDALANKYNKSMSISINDNY